MKINGTSALIGACVGALAAFAATMLLPALLVASLKLVLVGYLALIVINVFARRIAAFAATMMATDDSDEGGFVHIDPLTDEAVERIKKMRR